MSVGEPLPARSDGALVHRVRDAAGSPVGALLLLHGRGADEHDLFPLLDLLDPERRLLGLTARGPLSPPPPPGGAHWYRVRAVGYPDPATFRSTFERVTAWLDGMLAEHGLEHSRLVIGGFSQGTVMAYALGLGAGRPQPAALVGLSGFMPTVEGFELDLRDRSGFPVAIGHGELDPIIGVEWGREARDRLEAAGAEVTYEESRIGHQIDPRFMARLPAFVEAAVSTRAS